MATRYSQLLAAHKSSSCNRVMNMVCLCLAGALLLSSVPLSKATDVNQTTQPKHHLPRVFDLFPPALAKKCTDIFNEILLIGAIVVESGRDKFFSAIPELEEMVSRETGVRTERQVDTEGELDDTNRELLVNEIIEETQKRIPGYDLPFNAYDLALCFPYNFAKASWMARTGLVTAVPSVVAEMFPTESAAANRLQKVVTSLGFLEALDNPEDILKMRFVGAGATLLEPEVMQDATTLGHAALGSAAKFFLPQPEQLTIISGGLSKFVGNFTTAGAPHRAEHSQTKENGLRQSGNGMQGGDEESAISQDHGGVLSATRSSEESGGVPETKRSTVSGLFGEGNLSTEKRLRPGAMKGVLSGISPRVT